VICALIGGLAVLVAAVCVASLVWQFFVWGGIALYNTLADRPSTRVPQANLSKCYQVSFVIGLVQAFVGWAVERSSFVAGILAGLSHNEARLLAQLMGLPFGMLVMAVMLSALLPTSFGRAILVSLCVMLITIIVAFIVVAVVMGVVALRAA
jgi:hypothetical protein